MKKRLFLFCMTLVMSLAVVAQAPYYTRDFSDRKLCRTAQKWMKKGPWRHDFHKAEPHSTVNAVEFYRQYEKNPEQWRALFRWLADTDLLTIPAGRHKIEGSNLVASVEDGPNDPLEKRQSESHYHHIDFQYVVKGTERFALIDHQTSWPSCEYTPDVIHYNYDKRFAHFFDSTPDKFFLFFPCDWHIAKICTDKADQNIRVIVVKLDYID